MIDNNTCDLTIRSNRGDSSILLEVVNCYNSESEIFLVLNVSIKNKSWLVSESHKGSFESVVENCSTNFFQFSISNFDYRRLSETVKKWSNSGELFDFNAKNFKGDALSIRLIDESTEYIVDRHKPQLIFKLDSKPMKVQFSMILDRTSITFQANIL